MNGRRGVFTVGAAAAAFIALLPGIARAQGGTTAGAVAGVVRDMSSGVLPGVTVEASSPALIEKVRAGITNEEGQFQIVNLNPGEYTVTFTLPGFRTLRREGIQLSAGFTATVNVELGVGGLEETLTVTGEAPLVDTRATRQQTTLTRERMDELPMTRNYASMAAALIPGVTVSVQGASSNQDVGGTMGERNMVLSFHGSGANDTPQNLDGMRPGRGSGVMTLWLVNNGIVQETVIDTSGFTAETDASGLQVNYITKTGGNRFSGSFFGAYTNDALQANNIDDTMRARGLTPYVTSRIWDVNPAFGGPIKRDKLWFFYSYRNWGTNDRLPGAYFEKNPYDFAYELDPDRPATSSTWVTANNLRLTWQASPNNKFGLYADNIVRCICIRSAGTTLAPEATQNTVTPLNYYFQGTWNWTVSNRLLVEVAQSFKREQYTYYQYADASVQNPDFYPDAQGALDGIQVVDNGLGVTYRALGPQSQANTSHVHAGKANVSYVTGSHNLKAGAQWSPAQSFTSDANKIWSNSNVQYAYTFVNGVPSSVLFVAPGQTGNNVKLGLGLFVQDQWTIRRLTLNTGLRFDYQNGYIPAHQFPATTYVGPRSFPQMDCLPCWKDVSPRFGVSYDLFGNGKTALKWNMGRFVEALSLGQSIAAAADPGIATAVTRTTRAWTDRNADFIAQESELGASNNANFGTANVGIRYDPALVMSTNNRHWNWEWSAGIQHELMTGWALNAGYYNRFRGAFRVTQNTAVTQADYDPYCVTAPVDARLPNGGGYSVCGFYNVRQEKFGINDNVITLMDNFGGVIEHFDSVDLSINARLARGALFQAGTSTGRTRDNVCNLAANPTLSTLSSNLYQAGIALPTGGTIPNDPAYCDSSPPFQTQIKMLGVYPLPWWGIQTSATYQSLPGPLILANWSAPVSAVTGLGRPISGNLRNVPVPLVPPGTMYGERLHQIDLRVSKNFTVQGVRLQGQFDLYNLFNANAATQQNNTFNPANNAWQTPAGVMGGRLAKFGILIQF